MTRLINENALLSYEDSSEYEYDTESEKNVEDSSSEEEQSLLENNNPNSKPQRPGAIKSLLASMKRNSYQKVKEV
ncbi:4160_t:CDS:2 [Paraglomus brasilianum]|uniref:4160_t:CDS:1 n=1 Tax=Paraglomus brasilianum TaxID=144538 RepID=A0A9N8WN65_9GLOM|nr:4160_t:CDS:2 [Paraglomus brasilianum]